jgi:glycosyltransferase involved in cell wall biosynthesis
MNNRVCVFTSVHPPLDHRIFYKECKSLARAGYGVTIIAPHDRPEVVNGIRIVPLPRPKRRVSRIFRTGWQLYRKALAEEAAVYHFHDPELIWVGLLLRCHRKKVVYDIHEDVPQDLLHKFYIPLWLRWPLSWMASTVESIAARFLSGLIVVTPSIAERFKEHSSKVVLVRNFPVPEEFPPHLEIAWSQRDNAVIFVGSMSRNRGIRELVEAIGLVPEHLNSRLRLLGPFSMPNLLSELERVPGWDRVENLGTQDREGVIRSLSRVRAGLVTIHPVPQLTVSYPIKMFEYMAACVPIIASDFPTWRQFIMEARCGLLVNPLNPREISDAIEYILTHPKEAEEMGRNGRKAMETSFNWTHDERKLLAFYRGLSAPPPRQAPPGFGSAMASKHPSFAVTKPADRTWFDSDQPSAGQ